MALPTFTHVTDGVDDAQAEDINSAYDALEVIAPNTPAASYVNVASLTTDAILADDDLPVQSYDANGDYSIELPAIASTNHVFYIINRDSTNTLTITNDTPTTIATLPAGASGLFASDGTNDWYLLQPHTPVSQATTGAAGTAELAEISEINTGTDYTRIVTPNGLAGSKFATRYISFHLNGENALETGARVVQEIPSAMNGMNLVTVRGRVGDLSTGASSSGLVTFTITNLTDSQSMLSTNLTIDQGEYSSATATTAAVINTSYDDIADGDLIEVECTTPGTNTKNAHVTLGFI